MSFDSEARETLAQVLKEYGLTVAQAFKLFANRVVRRALLELSTLEWREVIFSLCSNAPSSSPPEPQSNPNPKSHLSDDSTD
ncbi:type II toxin-antitoxin system RelB/DinJ family antitoxin [Taylorella equigenitalis]|uniref:type II toxin-antitoxin system RelB/DinJ family antitoxin n=1 Tax=Taylorella equigenitalis TaxID=29575 RepID=UPI00041C41DB|nr:type II toxin-antitoxin system RelB/DinJ family antitoxin [Taylorella equigenitalis]ASY38469.1 hypothetical protein CA605_07360 [Taylorella equigenitalis]RBA27004.1 hypothetical protein DQW13_00735 [Taylorella equigenitalis]WDU46359.1 type II toxin-antitoxin system RelB/DinJ family antitoxin [Taylorella equigenitalis]WEE00391.1 type II toxin-antitoxin system RelB/DinJ family antitoxin [Taylorella equigenitalis]WEE01867.1 type II toxin-antitoxin system RelB/DinJ family antitoxin [Taylorella 